MAVIVAVLAVPRSVRACTFPVRPLEEYSEEVAVAFVGREIDRRERGGGTVLTFEVYRVYKGEVGPRIRLVGPGHESTCSAYIPSGTTAVLAGLELISLQSSFVSEADLKEVFGASYPPDETLLLPELSDNPTTIQTTVATADSTTPATTATSGNPTTIRQLASVGIALVVLSAGLIAIRRRRREGR